MMSGERHTDERRLLLTTVSVGNICEWAELRFELYEENWCYLSASTKYTVLFCLLYLLWRTQSIIGEMNKETDAKLSRI